MKHLAMVLAVSLGVMCGCDDGAGDDDLEPDPYYLDMDGDGYCPAGRDWEGDGDCTDPEDQQHVNWDCDDTDPGVYAGPPLVEEECDGIDNNCEGGIDEGLYQSCPCDCPEPRAFDLRCTHGEWPVCDCDVLCDSV